ncbi:MAG: hypothetical protein EOP83_24160 [Verrucomicrobiaceae bacterium]|nr:MAG: hypothetical protein EOP83_24160 [Verrucomicrobiaceae bacterium]
MAELMNHDDPLMPQEVFRPFDEEYPGLHKVTVRLPEPRPMIEQDMDDPLIVEIMEWMADPLLKGTYVIMQRTQQDPSYYQARMTQQPTGKAARRFVDKAVLFMTDVDTALACKIHWG